MILLQIPALVLAIYGVTRLYKRVETRTLAWLLTLYVGYYYCVVSVGMPMVRYFVPAVPFLLAAAAVGLAALLHAAETPSSVVTNLEPPKLYAAGSPRPGATIPVRICATPSDMDSINAVATKHKLSVVEDAAQAHGARYKGKRVGKLSAISCVSSYPTKNLGAFGEG